MSRLTNALLVVTALSWSTVLLSSCSYRRTQVVIAVRADSLVALTSNEIQIEVRDTENELRFSTTVNPQSPSFVGFPIQIPVTARRGDASRRFELRARAVSFQRQSDGSISTQVLAENRVRMGFQTGQVANFTLWLLGNCRCDPERERCEPDANGDGAPECVSVDARTMDDAGADAAQHDGGSDAARQSEDSGWRQDSSWDARIANDSSVVERSQDAVVVDRGVPQADANTCPASQRLCGSNCRSCPSDANAIETACSGTSCVIASCRAGYRICRGSCAVCPTGVSDTVCADDVCLAASSYTLLRSLVSTSTDALDGFGTGLSISSSGQYLATASLRNTSNDDRMGRVEVVDLNTGVAVALQRPASASHTFGRITAIAPNGSRLFAGDYDALYAFDFRAGSWSTGVYIGSGNSAIAAGDTTTLVSDVGANSFNGAVAYFSTYATSVTRSGLATPSNSFGTAFGYGRELAISSNGLTAIVTHWNGGLQGTRVYRNVSGVWDAGRLMPAATSDQPSVSGDGTMAAECHLSNIVIYRTLDLATTATIATEWSHKCHFNSAFSEIASIGTDSVIRFHRGANWPLAEQLDFAPRRIEVTATTPDLNTIAVTSIADGTPRRIDVFRRR